MSITINGSSGISGALGSAAAPAVRGADTDTGVFFPTIDSVSIATNGDSRLYVDANGNIGVGMTPSAWNSTTTAIDLSGGGGLGSTTGATTTSTFLTHNTYAHDAGWIYKNTGVASVLTTVDGAFEMSSAASGTSGQVADMKARFTFTPGSVVVYPNDTTYGASIKVGSSRTVDGYSYIDLIGDTTYTDFGARLIRAPGANGVTQLVHKGTGSLYMVTEQAAAIEFYTGNVRCAQFAANGQMWTEPTGTSMILPAYDCRAWVNFNGTGTVAIRASGNVSSITDNGTGDYFINFLTAMPDADYAVCGSVRAASPNHPVRAMAISDYTDPETWRCRIHTGTTGAATVVGRFEDPFIVTVAFFR